jgi:hypothetical protein
MCYHAALELGELSAVSRVISHTYPFPKTVIPGLRVPMLLVWLPKCTRLRAGQACPCHSRDSRERGDKKPGTGLDSQ